METKSINEMTLKEFEAFPHREWDKEMECTTLVILPRKKKHDSGYRCMDFVAVKNGKPICLLSGCSDVIHIDGIGGYGHQWLTQHNTVPKAIPPSGWSIDCLPKSGLLHIFPASRRIHCGSALSSFEIYALPREARP